MGIMGRIRVTPGWSDDPVWRHVDGWGGGAGVVCLPHTDIGRQEKRLVQVQ